MTAVTENDLKRLEDLIVSSMRVIESRLTSLENGQSEIKSDIKSLNGKTENIDKRLTSIEARLEAWKPSIDKTADLAEKVGELKNWRSIAFLVLGAILGWFARNSINP
jgi:predicted  nucleic acid-binding Zn-ribbon protein